MFRLLTLGGLSLTSDDANQSVRLPPYQLALLARLAASGASGLARDALLAMFWPDSDATRARGSLKQAIFAIRRALGHLDAITGTDVLQLNREIVESDIDAFRSALDTGNLDRAVALYNGPFLDAVHIRSGEFSRWRDVEAERLAQRYREALALLARGAESRGEFAAAVTFWRRLHTADPMSASVVTRLMGVLTQTGDRNAALMIGRGYINRVRSELETEPELEILDAVTDLAADARTLAAEGAKHAVALTATRAAPTFKSRINRRAVVAGVSVTGLIVTIGVLAVRIDENAIHVEASSAPQSATIERQFSGVIARYEPDVSLVRSSWPRARFQIIIDAQDRNDSLHLAARILDRRSSRWTTVGPLVSESASGLAVENLAERLALALVERRNPVFANWSYAAAMPITWAGYRAFAAGIEGQPFTNPDALHHLEKAGAHDTTSGTPVVWQAFVLSKLRRFAQSDSVLRNLGRSGRRQGSWDSSMVDLVRAWNRADLTTAHVAGHRVLETVPGSEWAILPAYDALQLGRARETLELLRNVPQHASWTRWWVMVAQGQALHLVGDYRTAARLARRAMATEPDRSLARQFLIAALAGTGAVDEVERLCRESLEMAHPQGLTAQPCGQAMIELWAHGHREAASRIADRFVALMGVESMSSEQIAADRAWAYGNVGRWHDAARVLAPFRPADVTNAETLEYMALTSAALGDGRGVAEARARLREVGFGFHPVFEAGMAALSGDRDSAVEWLRRGLREGTRLRTMLHWHAAFESLHGYPPFEAMKRVRDDREHRVHYAKSR